MITLADQIKEIEREIAMRRGVYPKWVASGKMKEEAAKQHIERMVAARETLAWLQKNEAAIKTKVEALS